MNVAFHLLALPVVIALSWLGPVGVARVIGPRGAAMTGWCLGAAVVLAGAGFTVLASERLPGPLPAVYAIAAAVGVVGAATWPRLRWWSGLVVLVIVPLFVQGILY